MIAKGQRWLCVRTKRAGTFIEIVGNLGCPEGEWWYENLSASRRRQLGKTTASQLLRSWEPRNCEHESCVDDCIVCLCPIHKKHAMLCGWCCRAEIVPEVSPW